MKIIEELNLAIERCDNELAFSILRTLKKYSAADSAEYIKEAKIREIPLDEISNSIRLSGLIGFSLEASISRAAFNGNTQLVTAMLFLNESLFIPAFISACRGGNLNTITALLELKIWQDDVLSDYGFAALCAASENGKVAVINFLAKNGVDVNGQNFNSEIDENEDLNQMRNSPIYYATINNHANAIFTLHALGADIESCDNDKRTLLHCAFEYQCKDSIKALIELGAKENAVDICGLTPEGYYNLRKDNFPS